MVVCHWYKTERDLGCNKDGTYNEGSRMNEKSSQDAMWEQNNEMTNKIRVE